MQFTVDSEQFLNALKLAEKALSNGDMPAVLHYALLQVKGDEVILTSYDLDYGIQINMPQWIEEEEGLDGLLIPVRTILPWLKRKVKSLPKAITKLRIALVETEDERKRIEFGERKNVHSFSCLSQEQFPVLPALEDPQSIDLDLAELNKAYSALQRSVEQDAFNPVLQGINFLGENNSMRMSATDTDTLSQCTLSSEGSMDANVTIPTRIFKEMPKAGTVQMLVAPVENHYRYKQLVGLKFKDHVRLIYALSDDYPGLRLEGTGFETQVVCDRKQLLNQLEIASRLGGVGVKLTAEDGTLKIQGWYQQWIGREYQTWTSINAFVLAQVITPVNAFVTIKNMITILKSSSAKEAYIDFQRQALNRNVVIVSFGLDLPIIHVCAAYVGDLMDEKEWGKAQLQEVRQGFFKTASPFLLQSLLEAIATADLIDPEEQTVTITDEDNASDEFDGEIPGTLLDYYQLEEVGIYNQPLIPRLIAEEDDQEEITGSLLDLFQLR